MKDLTTLQTNLLTNQLIDRTNNDLIINWTINAGINKRLGGRINFCQN